MYIKTTALFSRQSNEPLQIFKKSVVHCNITILLLLNSVFSIEPGHTAAFGGKS